MALPHVQVAAFASFWATLHMKETLHIQEGVLWGGFDAGGLHWRRLFSDSFAFAVWCWHTCQNFSLRISFIRAKSPRLGSLMGSMGRQEASGGDAGALRTSPDGHSSRQGKAELASYIVRITLFLVGIPSARSGLPNCPW